MIMKMRIKPDDLEMRLREKLNPDIIALKIVSERLFDVLNDFSRKYNVQVKKNPRKISW